MREEFRPAGIVTEFLGDIEQLVVSKTELLVWQTEYTGKRHKINASIVSYKSDDGQTLIYLDSPELENLKRKLTYYIYESKKGILFKGNYLRNDHEYQVLRADENVFLREKRHYSRVNFQYTKVFIDALYGGKLPFKDLLLRDISEDGFGLLLTESKSKGLLEGMELSITKIHSIPLPRPLEGKIIHRTLLKEKENPKKSIVKLGVKFNKPSKLVHLVMKAMDD